MCQISRYVETLSLAELVGLTRQYERLSSIVDSSTLSAVTTIFQRHVSALENAGVDCFSYHDLMPYIHRRLALMHVEFLISAADDFK